MVCVYGFGGVCDGWAPGIFRSDRGWTGAVYCRAQDGGGCVNVVLLDTGVRVWRVGGGRVVWDGLVCAGECTCRGEVRWCDAWLGVGGRCGVIESVPGGMWSALSSVFSLVAGVVLLFTWGKKIINSSVLAQF
eukprot:4451693-Amphidinium_carterae.1